MLVTALLSVAVAAVASAPDESWPGGDRTVNPGTDFFLFAKSPRDQEPTTMPVLPPVIYLRPAPAALPKVLFRAEVPGGEQAIEPAVLAAQTRQRAKTKCFAGVVGLSSPSARK